MTRKATCGAGLGRVLPGGYRSVSWSGRFIPWVIATALLCCNEKTPVPQTRIVTEFGIFFGGQVQQREKISFETDRSQQTTGFRITLPSPATLEHRVEWQLDMPGYTRGAPDTRGRIGNGRIVRLGESRMRPGERTFDQVLELQSNDPLGTWNIRVLLDGSIILDRPFLVVRAGS